jgi:hypothetical protein
LTRRGDGSGFDSPVMLVDLAADLGQLFASLQLEEGAAFAPATSRQTKTPKPALSGGIAGSPSPIIRSPADRFVSPGLLPFPTVT